MLKLLLLITVLDVCWATSVTIADERTVTPRRGRRIEPAKRGQERTSWRRELEVDDQEGAGDEAQPTFKPFSQEELNHYLKKYAESQHDAKVVDSPNRLQSSEQAEDKSKSWHLLHSQTHNHPYDDRMGWVTLEPVAWSQGKVQKWEPNTKPKPHWDRDDPPPYKRPERPYKPSYEYKPSPPHSSKPSHWDNEPQYSYGKPTYQPWNSNTEIITDNRPSQFPEPSSGTYSKPWHEGGGRPHSEVVYHSGHGGQGEGRPSGQPGDGDGHWVLISSTKGYSYPNRKGYQRSLDIKVAPNTTMTSRRTVRLTVLPADNETTKTTTSHGGLIEVESTSKTVDQSQREHAARMMKLQQHSKSTETIPKRAANRRSSTHFTVVPVTSHTDEAKNKALLAAVGAGMIPATVALMLPALAGRKKRSVPVNNTLRLTDHLLVQYM